MGTPHMGISTPEGRPGARQGVAPGGAGVAHLGPPHHNAPDPLLRDVITPPRTPTPRRGRAARADRGAGGGGAPPPPRRSPPPLWGGGRGARGASRRLRPAGGAAGVFRHVPKSAQECPFSGNVLQNSIVSCAGARPLGLPLPLLPSWVVRVSAPRHQRLTQRLRRASSCERWWGTAEQLDEPPQVLRGCGEQHLVPDAAQASQSKPVEPEDALHVCKPHLDLLALAA